MTQKKSPQDATLRNVRAANKKMANLVGHLKAVLALQAEHELRIRAIEVLLIEGAAEEARVKRRKK